MTTKDQLLSQTFALTNHVPSVDLGAFDLVVNAKEKRLDVVTRVFLELHDPQSQTKLVKFASQFAKLVPEVWDKQARFVCTKAAWGEIELKPHFKVDVVGLSNAHFRVKVKDEDETEHFKGPFAMITEKKATGAGVNPNFAPREGEFGSSAARKGEISSYRTNIIWTLSRAPLLVPLKAPPLQDATGRQRLERFAREVMAFKVPKKFHSSKRPRLTVKGCGSGDRRQRAAQAAAYLRTVGLKNPITEDATGDTAKPDGVELSFDNAELKALFPEKTASQKSLFQQITVAHEYGHMLGLPDEYLCMHSLTADAMKAILPITAPELNSYKGSGGSQIADIRQNNDGTMHIPHVVRHQEAFVRLCHSAKVVPPEFGRMSPSLMSNGMVFHPHHFVTLWEAVCKATQLDDWRIVV